MANFGQLDLQLHQIAWSAVARMPSGSGIRPADPWEDYHEASNLELRAGALALLRVYTQMIKVLQRRIDLTVKEALTYEASYGEIAAACGVSRQAARQRWLRRRERYELPKVRLVGGPQDGEWERVKPGEQVHVTLWNDGPRRPSGHATYAPSEDDPRSYVFTGLHEYDWEQRPAPPGAVTARVYQLAMEFEVDSMAIMNKLKEMGVFVRTASALVDGPTVRKLREHYAGRPAVRDNGGQHGRQDD